MRQSIALLLLLPGLALAEPKVIDRSVAMVNGQVLTASGLDFEARVLLVYAGGVEAAVAVLDAPVLRDSLDEVINQRLLTAEAEALGAYLLEEGELDAAMKKFKMRFDTQAAWLSFLDRHEVDEAQVAAVLGRLLRSQHVLEGKLRLKAQVSEAEAKRWLEAHPDFASVPLAAIRQKLFAERFRVLAQAEMREARKKAKLRLLGPYSEGADGGIG